MEIDIRQALFWYRMAAERNVLAAIHNLAVLYEIGHEGGLQPDSTTSDRYYEQVFPKKSLLKKRVKHDGVRGARMTPGDMWKNSKK